MDETKTALMFLFAAGVASGSFALPMKLTTLWAWENVWLVWTIFALLILPLGVTSARVPHIGLVYREAKVDLILKVAAFGTAWGIAQVLFGLAVDVIGLALSFSIVPGVSAALGSMIPLIRFHRADIFESSGIRVMSGIGLLTAGVGVCAAAGRRREAARRAPSIGKLSQTLGVCFALCSGLGSAMMNLGLAFGKPLLDSALAQGASPLWASSVVWLPVLITGAIPNMIYCLHLLKKNNTKRLFVAARTTHYWFYALVMAVLWFGSILLYGVACDELHGWGSVFGWPIFMSLIVITASLWSIATGEWKNSGNQSLLIQMGGVAMLVVAVFVLSAGPQHP